MIAVLARVVAAEPASQRPSSPGSHDPNGTPRAASPWLDKSGSAPIDQNFPDVGQKSPVSTPPALSTDVGGEVGADRTPRGNHRLGSALALAGFYAGFSTWAYFAWYRDHPPLSGFKAGGDGWFGVETYAGGADKLGHAWATMTLARMGSALLREGGWNPTGATLASAALSELLFLNVEIRDGFYFEFSYGDLVLNTSGMLAAIALDLWPRLDEFVDFRVQYFPSARYIENIDGSPNSDGSPSCPKGRCSRWNIAEDYSGQTFLLALHLGAFHGLRDWKYGQWSRFVDLALGFETRHYKPPPDPTNRPRAYQDLFFGVSLNAQGLFDYLLENRRHETLRKVTHGLFEVFNLPFTSVGVGPTRVSSRPPTSGGA